jgi:zinc protease
LRKTPGGGGYDARKTSSVAANSGNRDKENDLTRLQIPVESNTLENGLRVVVSPDRAAPVATVGVYYNIGFRLEPQGRSGFAHLFEHMMFQGSEHAGKTMHIKLINSSGGVLNGSTHYDVTNYYESVPSNALERVLWLEADRMRALKVDDENLRNQRDVVKEEVRANVLNQPYGGFPWLDLPPVAFRNWANAHNFYGDFADLDAATLADVQQFFRTYYAPSNAVLLMLGDLTPEEGFALARRHFAAIPAGPPRPSADVSEAPADGERRGEVEEKFGTLPGIAVGYRAPERRTPDWYALAMLDQALHGGRAGRVYRSLVLEQQIALEASGGIHYPVGDLFDYNGPTLLVTRFLYKPEYSAEKVLAAYDAVLDDVRQKGIERDELEQNKVKFRSDYFSSLEGGHGASIPRYGLMHYMACFTLFDGDPTLVNSILGGFLDVTPEQIRAAAQKYLDPARRALVVRRPVKKGAA